MSLDGGCSHWDKKDLGPRANRSGEGTLSLQKYIATRVNALSIMDYFLEGEGKGAKTEGIAAGSRALKERHMRRLGLGGTGMEGKRTDFHDR